MSIPRLLSVVHVAMMRATKPEDRERLERALDWEADIETWGTGVDVEAGQNSLMGG